MRWSDIPWRPPTSTLRWFGAIGLAWFVGLGLAVWVSRGDRATALGLGGLGLAVGSLGLVRPGVLRPVFVGWMVAAYPLGWLLSHLLLGVIFFGLFTPVRVFFWVAGRDPLDRLLDADRASYWVPKPGVNGIRSYFRQS